MSSWRLKGWKEFSTAAASGGECFDVRQGFLKTGISQVVAESGIDRGAVGAGPSGDFFRDLLERIEMGVGIPIPPRVILDHGHPPPQQGGEFGQGGLNGWE